MNIYRKYYNFWIAWILGVGCSLGACQSIGSHPVQKALIIRPVFAVDGRSASKEVKVAFLGGADDPPHWRTYGTGFRVPQAVTVKYYANGVLEVVWTSLPGAKEQLVVYGNGIDEFAVPSEEVRHVASKTEIEKLQPMQIKLYCNSAYIRPD